MLSRRRYSTRPGTEPPMRAIRLGHAIGRLEGLEGLVKSSCLPFWAFRRPATPRLLVET